MRDGGGGEGETKIKGLKKVDGSTLMIMIVSSFSFWVSNSNCQP